VCSIIRKIIHQYKQYKQSPFTSNHRTHTHKLVRVQQTQVDKIQPSHQRTFFQIILSLHSICERLVAERGHMIFTFKFHLILYYYYIIYIQFQQINDFFVLRVMVFQVFLLFVALLAPKII
jgi:hypothetical protein